MNSDERFYVVHAGICSALAQPVRLQIIECLLDGEKSVQEMVERIGAPQPTVSRHLAKMRHVGVVTFRREGQKVYYRLSSPYVAQAYTLMHTFAVEFLQQGAALAESR
ncbi:MAG: hypothetical protein Fur0018_24920 [Anaerolineales bacterium]